MKSSAKRIKLKRGYTIIELVVTVGLSSVLMGTAAFNLHEYEDAATSGVSEVAAFMKVTKARALSTVSAYKITPISSKRLKASYAEDCSESTFVDDDKLTLSLPGNGEFMSTNWSLCFSARGLPQTNLTLGVTDRDSFRQVEVMLGGAIRILD